MVAALPWAAPLPAWAPSTGDLMTAKATKHSNFRDDWRTPPWLFELLDDEFHFGVDVAASAENHLCQEYMTKDGPGGGGLNQHWVGWGAVWMNPPYGKGLIDWTRKAYELARDCSTTTVGILPNNTDAEWFHAHVLDRAEIRYIRGRVAFLHPDTGKPKAGNASGTIIAIWRPGGEHPPPQPPAAVRSTLADDGGRSHLPRPLDPGEGSRRPAGDADRIAQAEAEATGARRGAFEEARQTCLEVASQCSKDGFQIGEGVADACAAAIARLEGEP
jgi:phage N-6-adenine-methyltransferase